VAAVPFSSSNISTVLRSVSTTSIRVVRSFNHINSLEFFWKLSAVKEPLLGLNLFLGSGEFTWDSSTRICGFCFSKNYPEMMQNMDF